MGCSYEPTPLCKVVMSTAGFARANALRPFEQETESRMASLDLPRMRDEYRKDLFEDYLPFHERFVNDKQFGGFLCSVRPNGDLVSDEKRVWFEGRGIWVYSFLYNHLAREQKYLDTAAASVRLLARSKPHDPEEFRPKTYIATVLLWVRRTLRCTATCLSRKDWPSLPEASGDPNIGEKLGTSAEVCPPLRRARLLSRDRQDLPGTGRPSVPGARVQGVWMVLRARHDADAGHTADADLRRFPIADRRGPEPSLQSRFHLINELINHDGSRPKNEYEQLVYAGHAIETFWMLMDEALRRKDTSLFDKTSAMFKRHCEISRDRVYGGLLRNLTNVDQNAWTMDKTLFPHQEALIGSLMMIEQRGDPWARKFYLDIDRYTRAKFPLRSVPSPLWQVIGNRQVDPTPDMTRAENYHHPRFLMLNLLRWSE